MRTSFVSLLGSAVAAFLLACGSNSVGTRMGDDNASAQAGGSNDTTGAGGLGNGGASGASGTGGTSHAAGGSVGVGGAGGASGAGGSSLATVSCADLPLCDDFESAAADGPPSAAKWKVGAPNGMGTGTLADRWDASAQRYQVGPRERQGQLQQPHLLLQRDRGSGHRQARLRSHVRSLRASARRRTHHLHDHERHRGHERSPHGRSDEDHHVQPRAQRRDAARAESDGHREEPLTHAEHLDLPRVQDRWQHRRDSDLGRWQRDSSACTPTARPRKTSTGNGCRASTSRVSPTSSSVGRATRVET